MDRKEAFELLHLADNADKETVVNRYNTIFKKYRDTGKDENGIPLSKYEEAHNLLLGISFIDPVAEQRRQQRLEHPNVFLKWLKIDPEKTGNLIYYYKWHAIGFVLALSLVIGIVYNMVTQVKPNMLLLTIGAINIQNTEVLEENITAAVPTIEKLQFQQILIGFDGIDPQMEMAMAQKLQLELVAGKNDLIILDEKQYRQYASFGFFVPLDDQLERYGTTVSEQEALRVELVDDEVPTGVEHIFGIDVTESRFLKDNQVFGEKLVAVFPVTGENKENADALIRVLMMK